MLVRAPKCPTCGCGPSSDACILGTDDFADGIINEKFEVVGTPVEAGGLVTIESDDNEYLVWEDDPLLESGVTGVSAELDVRFDKEPDHPSIIDAYGQGHGFDFVWDWRDEDSFMACKLLFSGLVANPTLRITINNQISGSGAIGTFDLEADILPTDWIRLKVCIYQEADYYGYSHGEGDWKILVRAGGREHEFSIPTPENLRVGFGASLNVASPGTAVNPYQVDNLRVGKINANCHCEKSSPCLVYFNDMDGPDSSELGADFDEESGDWQRVSNQLKPPSTGSIYLNIVGPSIELNGAKWQSTFNFGGAVGKARWKVNSSKGGPYYYAEVECTDEDSATLNLFSSAGVPIADGGAATITGFNWNDTNNVAICVTKGALLANVNTSDATVTAGIAALEGLHVGLETVGVGSFARFDDLELSKIGPLCEGCSELIDCCVCELSGYKARKYVSATINGAALFGGLTVPCNLGHNHSIAGNYTPDHFNKTFILPLTECICDPNTEIGANCGLSSFKAPKYLRYGITIHLPDPPSSEDSINFFSVSVTYYQKEDGSWWAQGGISVTDEILVEGPNFLVNSSASFGPLPWNGEGDCFDLSLPTMISDGLVCHPFGGGPIGNLDFTASTMKVNTV